ncbi:TrbC/VirB2 family protein [Aquamicrobium sp. LC103]|uniref:TrbC/VirB2 family protein n=1 Tax=Aquamicrobium sp. LC103 TaxID=1120658 RepID=UPI00063EC0FB|nr:TrbC/VirB2 family protein [Aquamicrobium sp. LC103]TKT75688.1 Type IV secretory pathway AvhB2 protein [Aquamicrobium sp. LC103]
MTSEARFRQPATTAMAAVFWLAMIEPTFAQSGVENVLQNIVDMLQGNVTRLLAIIAVIIVGITWMFGFMDLRKAAYCVLGIGIAFGAHEVVNGLAGGGT